MESEKKILLFGNSIKFENTKQNERKSNEMENDLTPTQNILESSRSFQIE
jgi:hypothetical protein